MLQQAVPNMWTGGPALFQTWMDWQFELLFHSCSNADGLQKS